MRNNRKNLKGMKEVAMSDPVKPIEDAAKKAEATAKAAKSATTAARAVEGLKKHGGFWSGMWNAAKFEWANTFGAAIGEFSSSWVRRWIKPADAQLVQDILSLDPADLEKIVKKFQRGKSQYPDLVRGFCEATKGIDDQKKRAEILKKLASLKDEKDDEQFKMILDIVSKSFLEQLILGKGEIPEAIKAQLKEHIGHAKERIRKADRQIRKNVTPAFGQWVDGYAARTGADKTPLGRYLADLQHKLEAK